MDRNSIIGLLLIGAIMILFTIVNQPDRDALQIAETEQAIKDSLAQIQLDQNKKANPIINNQQELPDSIANQQLSSQYGDFYLAAKGSDTTFKYVNKLLSFNFQSKGGQLSQISVNDFKSWDGTELKMFEADSSKLSFAIPYGNGIISTSDLYFESISSPDFTKDSTQIVLRSNITENEWIDFIYTFRANSYKIGFVADFSRVSSKINQSIKELEVNWSALGRRQEKNLDNERNNTTVYYRNSKEDDVDKIAPFEAANETIEDPLEWIAFKEQFFAAVLISKQEILPGARLSSTIPASNDSITKGFTADFKIPFSPVTNNRLTFDLYAGPTKYNILKDQGHSLEELIPLGWGIFGYVNKIIVIPAFNFLGQFNLGYGIVILLLTIYIKLILLIFQYRSYLSQAKMRVLKPEIDEINKKFENGDAMQKQQATMGLYKEAGVNPLGGCLPMLFQIPVLFALFSFFPASIELRQEGFLWADDLSTYDSIVNLPFTIPFYGDHVSLFALLMTISTILYTRMNNQLSAGNTQMMPGLKYMMYFMPVIFLFVLNSYAAGLNYYYFLANIITFGQQFAFRKLVDDDKIHAKIQQKKKQPKSATKSTFQQKLEEMAKAKLNQPKKR
ncbi:MAG: membrane protein insertase YidC [Bacteroidia bacterium]